MNAASSSTDRRRAVLALIVVNAMWGSSFPIVKCLNLQIDQHFGVTELTASNWLRSGSAAWLISIRFSVALLLFGVFFRGVLRRVRLPHLLAGAAIGTLFFVGLLLQVIGLATIPASRSGFLTSLAVVFTPLFSAVLRGRLPRMAVLSAAVLALCGTAILTGLVEVRGGTVRIALDALERWTWGDSLTTLSAVFFSCQILLVDQLGKRYDSVAFTPSMFAATAMWAGLLFAVLRSQIPEATQTTWTSLAGQPQFYLLIALLCVFPSLLAFVWMNKYQPVISAGQAAVIYTLEPLFASFWAMFVPAWLSVLCWVSYHNEHFGPALLIGGALVLAANALALCEPAPPPTVTESPER